jgi:hypothetical protein
LEKLRTSLGIYQVILHAYVLMEKSLFADLGKTVGSRGVMSDRWRSISYKDKDLTPDRRWDCHLRCRTDATTAQRSWLMGEC